MKRHGVSTRLSTVDRQPTGAASGCASACDGRQSLRLVGSIVSASASIGCWRTSARVSDAGVDGAKVSVPNGRVGACYEPIRIRPLADLTRDIFRVTRR